MGLSGRFDREARGVAARRRRRDVRHAAAERHRRARREDRPHLLDLSVPRRARRARVLRPRSIAGWRFSATRSSWARSTRTSSPWTRRTAGCIWDTPIATAAQGYAVAMAPLVVKDKVIVGTAGGEQRHHRLRRGVRRRDRQGSVAVQHDSRPRRARQRDVGRRLVEARRRLAVGHRLVRSGPEPDLLGRRQSGTRLESRPAARRQPVYVLGARARRRHGPAEVALPVHAERRNGLGLGAGARARRHAVERHAAQAHAVGQPERVLLRARSDQRQVRPRRAVRQAELGRRSRRERPADSAAQHESLRAKAC